MCREPYPREPCCVLRNHSFVSNFQLDGLYGSNCLGQHYNGFRHSSGVIDIGRVDLRNEFNRLAFELNGAPVKR